MKFEMHSKKWIAGAAALTLMITTAVLPALAEDGSGAAAGQSATMVATMAKGGPGGGQRGPGGQMPGGQQNGNNQQGPRGQAPNGQATNGQMPDMKGSSQQAPNGQAPDMNGNGQQTPNGQAPDMNGNGQQAPNGQMPGMNGNSQQAPNGQMPDMNGNGQQAPNGQMPGERISFDDLKEQGVITQETLDAINAYMQENTPPALPDGQAPTDGQTPPALPDGQAPTDGQTENPLMKELLEKGIITQEIYDAILAWQASQAQTTTEQAAANAEA